MAIEMPSDRALEICGYTDALRELLDRQEADYRRAGMETDNKDRAEKVVQFLLAKERARG